jgi:TP901 family phage tail tape measure protein
VVDVAKLQVVVGADTSGAEKGFDSIGQRISSFAGVAQMALLGAGVAIAGAGAAAVTAAAGFEKTMSGVKAVSGATNEEMKGLSALALQLGKDTSFSASEAAAGIEELIKGGLSVADVMGGAAKATLNLAAAGGVSLPDAATIAANALAQFNLKGSDMAHVADLIAGAANASALDVGQFKFSLQAAGAVAATVGFTFDDLAQAIAVMGKAGITGSDAGTSLKTMFLNLQPSTDKARDAMKDLGIITAEGANRFFDATGKVRSMAEVAGVLNEATRNLTQQQKLATLQTIFGSDAIRAAAVFAKEGASGFDTMAASMSKVTAETVGAEKLNNLNGSVEQLKGSLETAAITLGMAFLPVLKKVTDGATAFINAAIPWIERHGPAFVAGLESTIAAAGRVVTAFGEQGLLGAMKALGGQEGLLTPAWNRITAALVDFEPTGLRIERLLNTLGTGISTILVPAVEKVTDFYKRWIQASDDGTTVMQRFAANINAQTAGIERMIDGLGELIRWLIKLEQTIRPIIDLMGGKAFADLVAGGKLPDWLGGGGGGTTGTSGTQTPIPAGRFGRDRGGFGAAGRPYLIGTGAQPELFVPHSAGRFQPAGTYGAGSGDVTVPVYIGSELITTVVAKANQRYADRGGR